MALSKKSEYFGSLSAEAKQRYENKLTVAGLSMYPYTMGECQWTRESEDIPQLSLANVKLLMLSTPTPYTKEAIKVW